MTGRLRRHLATARRRFAAGELGTGPEPGLHLAIVLVVTGELAVRALAGQALGPAVPLAACLTAATTVVFLAAPRTGDRGVSLAVLGALMNMLALGILLAGIPDLVVAPLVLLPLINLAQLRGVAGAAYGALGVVGLFLGPSLAIGQTDVVVPGVTAAVGALIALVAALDLRALASHRAELAHARAVVETLIDTVDVGLSLMDSQGRYEVVNRHHLELIALGHPDGHTAHDEDQHGPAHIYGVDRVTPLAREDRPARRAARGETFESQLVFVGPPGPEQRAVAVSARPVFKDGRRQATVLVHDDVTEAVSALRAKDDFIAMVSHELRTPLTSIFGYLDLAVDTEGLPADAAGHLAVVDRNAERLLRLVGDLLDAASAVDGRAELALDRVDLAAVVIEQTEQLRTYAQTRGIEILVETDEVPAVEADAHRIRQVVDNLVTNAVKYAGRSQSIRVQVTGGEACARLAVVDEGLGMTASEVEQAFSQFFRSPTLHDQSIAGVGLGLAICKSIVERHRGRIWLESAPGLGTTAVVELPLASAPA